MKAAVVQNIYYETNQSREILELAAAASYDVTVEFHVDLERPHTKQYLPEQKLEDLKFLINESEVRKVIFSQQLTPRQTFTLEEELDIDVIDKPMLILEIFEKKANSKDIQMQVQLAQLKYAVPRMVTEMGEAVRSERAGYGGSGEQVTDTLVSDMRRRIKTLERKIQEHREQHAHKYDSIYPRLPIVGYYSSGKSTLFNILSKADRDVGEEAFTTMFLKTGRTTIAGYPIDIIDTVGLADLPADILNAFDFMLSSIFSFEGMVLCLDTSLSKDAWLAQLEDFHGYADQFTSNHQPRVMIVLTKTDKADREVVMDRRAKVMKQDWEDEFAVITSTHDHPDTTQKAFVEAFESLFSDKLTEYFYQHISPSLASKLHDISRVEKQEWHSDGTTSLSGVAPKTVLNEYRGDFL